MIYPPVLAVRWLKNSRKCGTIKVIVSRLILKGWNSFLSTSIDSLQRFCVTCVLIGGGLCYSLHSSPHLCASLSCFTANCDALISCTGGRRQGFLIPADIRHYCFILQRLLSLQPNDGCRLASSVHIYYLSKKYDRDRRRFSGVWGNESCRLVVVSFSPWIYCKQSAHSRVIGIQLATPKV